MTSFDQTVENNVTFLRKYVISAEETHVGISHPVEVHSEDQVVKIGTAYTISQAMLRDRRLAIEDAELAVVEYELARKRDGETDGIFKTDPTIPVESDFTGLIRYTGLHIPDSWPMLVIDEQELSDLSKLFQTRPKSYDCGNEIDSLGCVFISGNIGADSVSNVYVVVMAPYRNFEDILETQYQNRISAPGDFNMTGTYSGSTTWSMFPHMRAWAGSLNLRSSSINGPSHTPNCAAWPYLSDCRATYFIGETEISALCYPEAIGFFPKKSITGVSATSFGIPYHPNLTHVDLKLYTVNKTENYTGVKDYIPSEYGLVTNIHISLNDPEGDIPYADERPSANPVLWNYTRSIFINHDGTTDFTLDIPTLKGFRENFNYGSILASVSSTSGVDLISVGLLNYTGLDDSTLLLTLAAPASLGIISAKPETFKFKLVFQFSDTGNMLVLAVNALYIPGYSPDMDTELTTANGRVINYVGRNEMIAGNEGLIVANVVQPANTYFTEIPRLGKFSWTKGVVYLPNGDVVLSDKALLSANGYSANIRLIPFVRNAFPFYNCSKILSLA